MSTTYVAGGWSGDGGGSEQSGEGGGNRILSSFYRSAQSDRDGYMDRVLPSLTDHEYTLSNVPAGTRSDAPDVDISRLGGN